MRFVHSTFAAGAALKLDVKKSSCCLSSSLPCQRGVWMSGNPSSGSMREFAIVVVSRERRESERDVCRQLFLPWCVCVCVFKGPLILFPRPPGDVSTRRSQHETEFRPKLKLEPERDRDAVLRTAYSRNKWNDRRIAAFAIRPWHLESSAINTERCAGENHDCGTRYEVNSMGNIDMRHSSWPLLFRRRSFGWNPSLNEHLLVHKHSDCIDKATRLPNCVQAPDLRLGAQLCLRLQGYTGIEGHNPTLLYLRSQSAPPLAATHDKKTLKIQWNMQNVF